MQTLKELHAVKRVFMQIGLRKALSWNQTHDLFATGQEPLMEPTQHHHATVILIKTCGPTKCMWCP